MNTLPGLLYARTKAMLMPAFVMQLNSGAYSWLREVQEKKSGKEAANENESGKLFPPPSGQGKRGFTYFGQRATNSANSGLGTSGLVEETVPV